MVSPQGRDARVVVGVGAGIAAYKVCELVRMFAERGHPTRVLPTADALRFVGEASWAALSRAPVAVDMWSEVHEVPHVRIGQDADLMVVAPATANLLAQAAHGFAGDLLTGTLLTARCPVVFAPAMHTEMWEHPATRANVALLRQRGAVVLDPAVGRLTGPDSGPGRLPDPEEIFAVCVRVLARGAAGARPDLAGRHVVVTAGGTREPIDPVRFLGNRSSGRQGYALARTALARGARVSVVAANVALPDPAGARVVAVGTAEQMRTAVVEAAGSADAVVMAAAVADFRPRARAAEKIKKAGGMPPLVLEHTPDILTEISHRRSRPGQVIVGFAAETEDALANGRNKLEGKGCDLLVVNEVGGGRGFETAENAAVVLGADGTETTVPPGPKEALAEAIWDLVAARLEPGLERRLEPGGGQLGGQLGEG